MSHKPQETHAKSEEKAVHRVISFMGYRGKISTFQQFSPKKTHCLFTSTLFY
jgi:hypothetical protein